MRAESIIIGEGRESALTVCLHHIKNGIIFFTAFCRSQRLKFKTFPLEHLIPTKSFWKTDFFWKKTKTKNGSVWTHDAHWCALSPAYTTTAWFRQYPVQLLMVTYFLMLLRTLTFFLPLIFTINRNGKRHLAVIKNRFRHFCTSLYFQKSRKYFMSMK